MLRRNGSVFLFLFMFLGLLAVLFWKAPSKISPLLETPQEPVSSEVLFHGRLKPLSISDLYVIENSAERDIESLLTYLQGRLSSLHYLFEAKVPRRKRNKEDLLIGLLVEINQEGTFKNAKIQFNSAKNSEMNKPLVQFVEKYWKYKRAENGSTTILIPLQWSAKYSRVLLNDTQLE